MSTANRCARVLVLVAWMALITYWSSQGNLPIDQPRIQNVLHGLQHRIAHLFAFGLLALLARWAFDGAPRAAMWAVVLTSMFGATDEWHQSFTPGRRAAVDDWLLDTLSAALALYVWARVRSTRWQNSIRAFAPLAVSALFVVGIGLAARPLLPLPSGTSVRAITSEAAASLIQLARDTRNAARQLRSSAAG